MPDFSKSHFCLLMLLLGFNSAEEATTPPSVQSQTHLTSTPNLNSPDEQNVADQCFTAVPCPADAKYRTMDGTCNNLNKTWWGSAGTPYVRLLKANYKDSDNNYRVSVVNGSALPNARLLTTVFLRPFLNKPDVFTRMFASFGQVIAHDALANPRSTGSCCSPTGDAVVSTTGGCRPIVVPDDDPYYSQFGRKCLEYRQSLSLNCSSLPPSPLLPIGRDTHFIDASFIYGSNDAVSLRLRSRTGGKLAVSNGSNGRQYLPTQAPSNCPFAKNICYNGADRRANQNLDLAVVETVWLRFHNYLASTIAEMLPSSTDDETLFQESRRWLIAFLQHITFGEWLPRFLGVEYCTHYGLLPLTSGYATGYNPNLNPSSLADFAGAAFRTLHSNIPDYTTILVNGSSQSVPFSSTLERAGDYLQVDGALDSDVLDLTNTLEQKLDNQYTLQLLDHFIQFSTPIINGSVKFGDDLAAMDIQRGRDYGLRAYNDYRQLGGQKPFTSFEDIGAAFGSKISTLLAQYYNSPYDIEYYVGSVIEASVKGVAEAHSLRCVWGEAFRRYKFGDRFYYEFGEHGGAFRPDQLQFIRSIKLAHVVCIGADNIASIQLDVFEMPNVTNALTPCSELLQTFLSGFKASFNSS